MIISELFKPPEFLKEAVIHIANNITVLLNPGFTEQNLAAKILCPINHMMKINL